MNKENFKEWMSIVDELLEGNCGLSSDDLSDCAYADMYENGDTPDEAVSFVLSENGFVQEKL